MLIREIMTEEVVTVHVDDSVEKCANLLLQHNISGLPVVDDHHKVVGMVTEGDLIRRAARIQAPGYLDILGGLIYLGDPKKFVNELKRAMSLKAGDLMTPGVISISPDDDTEVAATAMLKNNISRIPVIDGNKKLVGIVSRRDIMLSLYKTE
ncbi:MAG: CBS domain-containing protein [Firmicutes bacterium]|jgi:CBS domain-containing protein|nr:CBS domain-containing protein [Bacillota bacterium]